MTSALVELQNIVGVDLNMTPGTGRVRHGMEISTEKLEQYLSQKHGISGIDH